MIPTVFTPTLWEGLLGVVTELLINGATAVVLVGRPQDDLPDDESTKAFDDLRALLNAGLWVDSGVPIGEDRRGAATVRVPNPRDSRCELPRRLRLVDLSPAAAVLQAFTLLRVRFYPGNLSDKPEMRLFAPADHPTVVDTLYLIGDAFTERYPIQASLHRDGINVILGLTGEPAPVPGGWAWPREDYRRCRDASLLVRPLREALNGSVRPLTVPRCMIGGEAVRTRLPEGGKAITRMAWVDRLDQLAIPPEGEAIGLVGSLGEHRTDSPNRSGTLVGFVGEAIESLTGVRADAMVRPEPIEPEPSGRVTVWFEGLGGVREIGANAYYYRFGRRGLLFDAGVDANRDGWLGVPALERIGPLNAIVLTHAHLDHVGAVPLLLAAFPGVPVYCTRATYELLAPTFDGSKAAWEEQKVRGELPAMSKGLADRINAGRFRLIDFGQTTAVPEIPGLTLAFWNAGHMVGAVYTDLAFGGMSIAHTGDISLLDLTVQAGLDLAGREADHVVMEGTYGYNPQSNRASRQAAIDALLAAVEQRVTAGGVVLIPSFTLGRAQELVALLAGLNARMGLRVPIRTVGMINQVNELIRIHLSEFLPGLSTESFRDVSCLDLQRIPDKDARQLADAANLRELSATGPCVVVASHGMMSENTGSYRLGRAILTSADPRHAIFLCGYMDPRTPGFRLRSQAARNVIDFGYGDPIVRAIPPESIVPFSMSSHASFEELVEVAEQVARKTLVLVHGEGEGLDKLKSHLEEVYLACRRTVTVHAPGGGQRVVFGTVDAPSDWDRDVPIVTEFASLAPERRSVKPGWIVHELIPDGNWSWAVIPFGQDTARVGLRAERVFPERLLKVTIKDPVTPPTVVFDRAAGIGSLRSIDLPTPGIWRLCVTVLEADSNKREVWLKVHVAQELRLASTELDAPSPVLEVDVGGTLTPSPEATRIEHEAEPLPVRDVEWDGNLRRLRIRLGAFAAVGSLGEVRPIVTWSNEFVQNGPAWRGLAVEPRVRVVWPVGRVGAPVTTAVDCSPAPLVVKIRGETVSVEDGQVTFTPTRPGPHDVLIAFRGLGGGTEWREVGSIDVAALAEVVAPQWTIRGQSFTVHVQKFDPQILGTDVTLYCDDALVSEWEAGDARVAVTMDAPIEAEAVSVTIRAKDTGWVLAEKMVTVLPGLVLDDRSSIRVATADGQQLAELVWRGLQPGDNHKISGLFSSAGFTCSWGNLNTLQLKGSDKTIGWKVIEVQDLVVVVRTIRGLTITMPYGPVVAGRSVTLAAGDATPAADDPENPFGWEVDRVAPVFDGLSARVDGNTVTFLHPGRYAIALTARGRRLAEAVLDVVSPPNGPPTLLIPYRRRTDLTTAEVIASFAEPRPMVLFVDQSHSISEGVGSQNDLDEVGREWLSQELANDRRVMIVYPGLSLPPLAGGWLAWLSGQPDRPGLAHLPYPTPRGECMTSDIAARLLRSDHRVQCCWQSNSEVNSNDEYSCPICTGRPRVTTTRAAAKLACPACDWSDHNIVLSLSDLRVRPPRVLVAEFRTMRYLMTGRGTRYGGSFARTVRCSTCHRQQLAYTRPNPWDATSLDSLLAAVRTIRPDGSPASGRRVAKEAVRRRRKRGIAEIDRAYEELNRLMECEIQFSNPDPEMIHRLTMGYSLCCGSDLISVSPQVSYIIVGLERLFWPSGWCPGLRPGAAGVQQILNSALQSA